MQTEESKRDSGMASDVYACLGGCAAHFSSKILCHKMSKIESFDCAVGSEV